MHDAPETFLFAVKPLARQTAFILTCVQCILYGTLTLDLSLRKHCITMILASDADNVAKHCDVLCYKKMPKHYISYEYSGRPTMH